MSSGSVSTLEFVRVLGLALLAACVRNTGGAATAAQPAEQRGVFVVDAGGRRISNLEAGSTLHVGAGGLRANTVYEFRMGIDQRAMSSRRESISFARVTSDRSGTVAPFVLWYESGVVGCSDIPRAQEQPWRFRTFEDAERRLRGRTLRIAAYAVEADSTGRRPIFGLKVGAAEFAINLPIVPRRSPMVFASTAAGCLLNSQRSEERDVYVSGRNFVPGDVLELSMVPNQRAWYVGDVINDVTGAGSTAASERVRVDSTGRFTIRVWDRATQRRGTYDIVAHRLERDTTMLRRIVRDDIISFGAETGFLLFLRYPVGGPTMDIAGRPLGRSPYFEFADAFAETNDPVWGAVDPTYVPAGHTGGTYAAYYVVNHRDVAGWNPAMGGSTSLTDVSGGIEVHPVKAGCVNGTDVIIWNAPLSLGTFDVVVDFGSVAAATAAQYATDANYDETVDFLDGADQVGFTVARDPYELGPVPIGEDSYSTDDFFTTLGGASSVDLRAVVRYPATAAGAGQPVAAGTHPLFIIEHGNHGFCRSAGSHATCPVADRIRNHEGYMRLLDILASHGVIAVSIDAYDLTGGVPQWIWERGTLILKHIELWSHLNDATTFISYPNYFAGRFTGHVDLTNISVSGHSRGGEASVAAYMLNLASASPFAIKSVSSIAPVDGLGYTLPDVPYFVMLPAADGDVTLLRGQRIYDRAGSGLALPDATTKSGIHVYGANHNFFNTVWAADNDDYVTWIDPTTVRADFIPSTDQQRLGEAYLAAFHRIHLTNEIVYEDMFRGGLVFPSTSGRKIYYFHHEKSHAKQEAGGGAGAVSSGGASVVSVANPGVHQTQAIRVAWPSAAGEVTYSLPLGQRDASTFEVLSFRAAQTLSPTNPAMGSQDFQVELVGGGKVKAVYISSFDPIPRPYPRPDGSRIVMTTVRIPLHSFIMNNAGVTLNNIDTIRFRFLNPSSGEVYVDDIEFSR